MALWVLHLGEVLLALGAFVHLTKSAKFGGFDVDASISRAEVAWLAAAAAAISLVGSLGSRWIGALTAIVGAAIVLGLWLDAVLFRVFTIELGPGGVGDVVLSVLYRELGELAHARRFFARHKAFVLLPAAVALIIADASLGLSGVIHRGLLVIAAASLSMASLSATGRGRLRGAAIAALFAAMTYAELAAGGVTSAAIAAGAAVALVFVARDPAPGESAPAGIQHFFVARRCIDDPAFVPRPEHAPILARAPRVPAPSPLHGRLRGADVVLLTFESVGRDHLAAYRPDGAVTPFVDALLARGTSSDRHFCVCPTTNNAHRALYSSNYGERSGGGVAALRSAGFRTVYLTAARTEDYGLRNLIARAGFSTVIDSGALGSAPSDYDLLGRGLDLLARLPRDGRPLFLHVHATHTHVPYRVVDRPRFARFDADDDRGRFRNGIEETDHIFARLLDALLERGIVRDPLVIATSDHGQAFGALGYQSHGSAVVADETLVPLLLAHPALPARRLPASSHFDVLPTVLDLVGVPAREPGFGESLFAERRPDAPCLLLWAGHPSRTTTTNYGVVCGQEKLMLDLVLDRCHRMDWDDRGAVELEGAEKAYVAALIGRLAKLRGVP